MPVSRRARFAPPRRTNREARHGPDAETGGDEVGIVQSAEGLQVEPAPDGSMLKDIALTLWTPTYDPVFQLELERNRAALASRGGTLGGFGLTVHAKRLTGHHREVWERRQLVRERDQLAIALHADNMRHWLGIGRHRWSPGRWRTSRSRHLGCTMSRAGSAASHRVPPP